MKCSDKEWRHCNKEKMGCEGCFYNDEIRVGEFVRTKNQGIKRIDTIWGNKTVNKYGYEIGSEWDGKLYLTIKTTDILKHSKDILDLIQKDDFVNGVRILDITGDYIHTAEWDCCKERLRNKLKSILTKEQFEANVYKIEE